MSKQIIKESKKHIEGRKITKSKHYLVKELKETSSIDEVNHLVKNGWIMLDVLKQPIEEIEFLFALGRIEGDI